MRDLQRLLNKCTEKLNAISIPIGFVYYIQFARLSHLGDCHEEYENMFKIRISSFFDNDRIDISDLKAVICHELLHTCKDCDEHNEQWREYARFADETYHYNIMEFREKSELRIKHRPILHHMKCPHCGGFWNIRSEKLWQDVLKDNDFVCMWCRQQCEIEY